MTFSGNFYTSDKDAACAARRVFFDYLTEPSFDVQTYCVKDRLIHDDAWIEYDIEVANVPISIYDAFAKVYIGEDAIYRYRVGTCGIVRRS